MWILFIIAGIGIKPPLLLNNIDLYNKNTFLINADAPKEDTTTGLLPSLSSLVRHPEGEIIAAEFLGGALGGALGGVGGFASVWIFLGGTGTDHSNGEWGLLRFICALALGAPPGILLGTPAGVTITGRILGDDKGNYWKSLLGTVIGGAAGVAFFYVSSANGLSMPFSIGIGSIFPIIGAVQGYNFK